LPLIDTPKEFLTEEIWKSGFRGIFVGGCIERKEGSSFRRKAHAHCFRKETSIYLGDKYFGYICVRSPKRLFMKNGKPSLLLWHELAHIVTQAGHGDKKYWEWLKKHSRIMPFDRRFKWARELPAWAVSSIIEHTKEDKQTNEKTL
jgi:hypothetical protein